MTNLSQKPPPWSVGVLLFDRFTTLDVNGPVNAFGSAGRRAADGTFEPLFKVFCMAETAGAYRTDQGVSMLADYAFEAAPPFDILVIPGGWGTREAVNDARLVEWIARLARRATVTATVCTGSALLAQTGLLDGRRATSNKLAWAWVTGLRPQVHWVRKARWVDEGDVITSSGVSAGTDMALALIARLTEESVAEASARRMEYVRTREPDDDPFA